MLVQQHIDKLNPADDIEFSAIEEMVSSVWRMRRLWSSEKHLFDKTVSDLDKTHISRTTIPKDDEGDRIAAAFSKLVPRPGTPPARSLRIAAAPHLSALPEQSAPLA